VFKQRSASGVMNYYRKLRNCTKLSNADKSSND